MDTDRESEAQSGRGGRTKRIIVILMGGLLALGLIIAASQVLPSQSSNNVTTGTVEGVPPNTYVGCNHLVDCLASARRAGVDAGVEVPGQGVVFLRGWFYPPKDGSAWGFRFEFRNTHSQQQFEDLVDASTLSLPCPTQNPAPAGLKTAPGGRQVCVEANDILRFYSGGAVYVISVPNPGTFRNGQSLPFLLDEVGSFHSTSG